MKGALAYGGSLGKVRIGLQFGLDAIATIGCIGIEFGTRGVGGAKGVVQIAFVGHGGLSSVIARQRPVPEAVPGMGPLLPRFGLFRMEPAK